MEQPVLVTGNTIRNNTQDGIVASEGAIVIIGGSIDGQANSILNNAGNGISLFDTNTYAKIVGNTIEGNQEAAGVYIDGGQADIVGNAVQKTALGVSTANREPNSLWEEQRRQRKIPSKIIVSVFSWKV